VAEITNAQILAAEEIRTELDIMSLDVEAIRKDFPILQRRINNKRLVFLDSAASSQRPRQVIDAMSNYYEQHHANVHRSVYTLAEEATQMYEGGRAKIARFINAASTKEVLFGKNVTEQLNLVAHSWGRANLKQGDVIVLTEMEHHANLVPWFMLAEEKGLTIRYIDVTDDGRLDLSNLDASLNGAKLIAFTGVSNVLGTINPVTEITAAARKAGAVSVVDFAQWTPHMKTDVQAMGADFIAFTGHKLLGPTGVGVLWGRQELLEAMPPFLGGGDMILDVRLDGFTPNELPWKFEAGTPPIAEVIGLAAAIDYLNVLDLSVVREHERNVTEYALDLLHERLGDAITIFGPTDMDQRGGTISFELEGVHPHDIGQVLSEEGVCIRAGHHCAKPLHRKLGFPATARASFYVYNDKDDADALADALIKAREFFS
jgi:cysteine desulfurase / selenocysteine lyase